MELVLVGVVSSWVSAGVSAWFVGRFVGVGGSLKNLDLIDYQMLGWSILFGPIMLHAVIKTLCGELS